MLDDLIPQPRRIESQDGPALAPGAGFRLVHELDDKRIEAAFEQLLPSGPTRVLLRIEPALGDEAYELRVGEAVAIAAGGYRGAVHGFATLAQLAEDGALPRVVISDAPLAPVRGLHIDLARRMVYRGEYLRRVLVRMAKFKLNVLHLYLENKFHFASCSAVIEEDTMTPDDARALVTFAGVLGIEIVPQVNTLGHMELFLNHEELAHLRERDDQAFNLCPTHPEARPFLAGLLRDVAEAFRPKHIHIGQDESAAGGCDRCKQHGEPHEVLAEHIRYLADEVQALGARPMMYGDRFLALSQFPYADAANADSHDAAVAALRQVPRDMIITDWHYTAPHANSWRFFVDEGFETQVATATNQYWHDFCPVVHGMRWIAETIGNALKQGAQGGFNCTWELVRSTSFENFWPMQAVAAEALWSGGTFDRLSFSRRFHRRFWGVDEPYWEEIVATSTWKGEISSLPTRRAFYADSTLASFWKSFREDRGGEPGLYEVLHRGVRDGCFLWAARNILDGGEAAMRLLERFRAEATRNRDTLDWLDILPRNAITHGLRLVVLREVIDALKAGRVTHARNELKRLVSDAVSFDKRLAEHHQAIGGGRRDRWQFLLTLHEMELIDKELSAMGDRAMTEDEIWRLLDRGVDMYAYMPTVEW